MPAQLRKYTGEQIDVTYDAQRCLHVAECIRRLPAVFDTSKRPWIQTDQVSAEQVAATVEACPSGALHYERKDGGSAEPIPMNNTIRLVKNGPLYVRGDFTIVNSSGELVLTDTRAALCRCGASANKPFCDNSHRTIEFQASATVSKPQIVTAATESGDLRIEPTRNGPLHITGNFTVLDGKGEPVWQGDDAWLCRCGGSANKPFCDGTHKKIGFIAE